MQAVDEVPLVVPFFNCEFDGHDLHGKIELTASASRYSFFGQVLMKVGIDAAVLK